MNYATVSTDVSHLYPDYSGFVWFVFKNHSLFWLSFMHISKSLIQVEFSLCLSKTTSNLRWALCSLWFWWPHLQPAKNGLTLQSSRHIFPLEILFPKGLHWHQDNGKSSQRLKQQAHILCGSASGPLHIYHSFQFAIFHVTPEYVNKWVGLQFLCLLLSSFLSVSIFSVVVFVLSHHLSPVKWAMINDKSDSSYCQRCEARWVLLHF